MQQTECIYMRIAVLFNKPADRFAQDTSHVEAEDDTELSAREVAMALEEYDADVTLVPITEHSIEETINTLDADLIFNLIEWTGVDTPFAIETFDRMDARGMLYTGATKQSYLDSCDKRAIKTLCDTHGLPTAQWQAFETGEETIREDLTYPMIVKVSLEHSSVGIGIDSIVRDATELRSVVRKRIAEYAQPVFAETFLAGREFQVTLLDKADGLTVLPPAEVIYQGNTAVPLLTYESRWDEHHSDYANSTVRLADLDGALKQQLTDISNTAFTELGFRDYARFDIRCDGLGHPFFLELNSNPGLGDDEEYGMTVSYKAVGMRFADLVWEIVQAALRRTS